MPAPETTKAVARDRLDRSRSGPLGVVDAWADLVKACAIYASSHQRVRDALAALQSILGDRISAGVELSVTFSTDKAKVGEEEIDLARSPNAKWLREKLDKSLLAGAAFSPGIDARALLAFAERLIANSQQRLREPKFAELWPESYTGVQPLPRQYEDVFLGSGGAGSDTEQGSRADAVSRKLAEQLVTSEVVQRRVARLETIIESMINRDTPGQECVTVDLLTEIVRQMPVEACADEARAADLTAAILDAVATELSARRSSGAVANRLAIEQVMHSISRKYFFDASTTRASTTDTEKQKLVETEAGRGDLDNRVDDDVPALLAELHALPDLPIDLHKEAELPQEQLGVYLHFLIHSKPGEQTVRLHPVLRRLLIDVDREGLDCLCSYLEYAEQQAQEVDDWTYLDNVTSFLASSNLMGLARRCGYLSLPRLRRLFPRLFLPFVATIDWRQESNVTMLEQLCALLGPDTIRRNREALATDGGLSANGVDLQILGHPRPAFLPLAHLILAESGLARSEAVATFLTRVLPQTRETHLLSLWPHPAQIPIEYLSLLAQRSPTAHYPPSLPAVMVRLLRRLIEDNASDAKNTDVRSKAIRMLGDLGAKDLRPFLLEILNARRLLVLPREPSQVRQAAREALARLGPEEDHV